MTRDDIERLVGVELKLEALETSLQEHRTESKSERKEMHDMIVQLGVKIDAAKFNWSALFTRENIKAILYIALTLTGAAGAAKAIWE